MTRTASAQHRYVTAGLGRVRVRVIGEGEPLLLLMGIGGHLDMWQPLSDELKDRQLVMIDFPGTGGSTWPWFPPTMAHGALFVRFLMKKLGYQSMDVLGYSWGGLLAQQLAAQHPKNVRKLVLACTGPGVLCLPADPRVAARLLTPRRYYSPSYLAKIAADTYGGEFRRQADLVDAEMTRRMDRPPALLGYTWQLLAAATFTVVPLAPRIKQPTLILGGDDDPIVRAGNQRLLHRLLRNSNLNVVENAGHLMLIDSPARSASLINAFLQEEVA